MSNNTIVVELYDLKFTGRKDDKYGQVVKTKSLTENDLIKIAVQNRSDLSPTTLRSSLQILKDIAIEAICNGASVSFGLGYFYLTVRGTFTGENPQWDPSKNSLGLAMRPSVKLQEAVKSARVTVRKAAQIGTSISTVTDRLSGTVNSRISPGNPLIIIGKNLKIAGSDLSNGIYLLNQETGEIIPVPKTSIPINNPKRLVVIVPATLPAGNYKLRIRTQYSCSSTLLKAPRDYDFFVELTAE